MKSNKMLQIILVVLVCCLLWQRLGLFTPQIPVELKKQTQLKNTLSQSPNDL